jgi:hypothetical protein
MYNHIQEGFMKKNYPGVPSFQNTLKATHVSPKRTAASRAEELPKVREYYDRLDDILSPFWAWRSKSI